MHGLILISLDREGENWDAHQDFNGTLNVYVPLSHSSFGCSPVKTTTVCKHFSSDAPPDDRGPQLS